MRWGKCKKTHALINKDLPTSTAQFGKYYVYVFRSAEVQQREVQTLE